MKLGVKSSLCEKTDLTASAGKGCLPVSNRTHTKGQPEASPLLRFTKLGSQLNCIPHKGMFSKGKWSALFPSTDHHCPRHKSFHPREGLRARELKNNKSNGFLQEDSGGP
ncbi:hypothetical protein AV530_008659 [Patagioenas fasciata monilis]|uniref:Uncharacterized protein n=1 Tax=Patagioenas fasciata monilis TaxID=372326 RepID=A0A1V4L177_PATFA|nr:hypothetical protein AV530_008659 [Patagioenas fasciata monilis]